MPEVLSNLVRFTTSDGVRLPLSMEAAFTLTAGLSPNVNTARVAWGDWERIAKDPGRSGKLEFWSHAAAGGTSEPDYSIEPITIVDAEPIEPGAKWDESRKKAVRMFGGVRLYLADLRHRFISPRGGNLRIGKVNLREDTDPRPNSRLIEICLLLMGFGPSNYVVDGDVDLRPAVRELDWTGKHAPTELGKILEEIGAVFCLQSDGSCWVGPAGKATAPLATPAGRTLEEISLPNMDRRGKTVVFTSAPNRVVNTVSVSGPSEDTWQFVLQDSVYPDDWVEVDELSIFAATDPVTATQEGFANQSAAEREYLAGHLWRYIRLNPENHPESILRSVWPGTGSAVSIDVRAKIATVNSDGYYENATDKVRVKASFLHTEAKLRPGVRVNPSIIEVSVPLVQTTASGAATNWWEHMSRLIEGDLEVTYSREEYEVDGTGAPVLDEDGQVKPVYFDLGYLWENGAAKKLEADELRNALADPATIVVPMPQWILRRVNGADQNRSELEAEAATLAGRYLAGSGGRPREVQVIGFCQVELSGEVAEIQVDQRGVCTRIRCNTWYMPREAMKLGQWREGQRKGGAGAGAGGGEMDMVAIDRLRRGAEQMPVVPIAPSGGGVGGGGAESVVAVKITSNAAGGGQYNGRILSGSSSADGAGNLAMPEGMTVPGADDAIVLNEEEDGLATHWLAAGSYALGKRVGSVGGKMIVVIPTGAARTASPATLGAGSEGSETASTDTWTRGAVTSGSDYGDCAVEEWYVSRVVYNDSGNETIYAFLRKRTVDASGRLESISGETRVTVDVPEDC